MTRTFFFPVLFLRPAGEWKAALNDSPFQLIKRRWETSTFDLATLASRHRLHLPYQVMEVMLQQCNLELRIEADSLDDAIGRMSAFLLGLYAGGASPTIAPFATTYSINEYSGINSRDSTLLKAQLPEGMRTGITSDKATVEAWPIQLSFSCLCFSEGAEITVEAFHAAATTAREWRDLETRNPTLRVVRDAAQAAPLLGSRDQSLLHVWCALEALFPKVSTEVSFRMPLYLAQLQSSSPRQAFFKLARNAYRLRSRVAHGAHRSITQDEWKHAWDLLCASVRAILDRKDLPSEDALLEELLEGVDGLPNSNLS
jgi:hypothetical protein